MFLTNIILLIKSKIFWLGFLFGSLIIYGISYYFTDRELIIGNLGYNFFITEIVSTILIGILFGVFLGSTLFKIYYFKSFDSKKSYGGGFLGGILGVIVAGCPSCSITLATYLGLSSIFIIFPFFGLELKILGIILLVFVVYYNIKNLTICNITKNDKPSY